MRILTILVALLASLSLGTLLILLAAVGLGSCVARLLPFSLFQASLLCLFSLVAFVVLVARIAQAVASLLSSTAEAPGVGEDDGIEEGAPPRSAPPRLISLVTESVEAPPRQRRSQRRSRRDPTPPIG